jgi:hypothetical protein
MVVAQALDLPGAVGQGFDLHARLMIASALEDLAEALLEEPKPLPAPAQGLPTRHRIGSLAGSRGNRSRAETAQAVRAPASKWDAL